MTERMTDEQRRIGMLIAQGVMNLSVNQQFYLLGYMEGLKNAKVKGESVND